MPVFVVLIITALLAGLSSIYNFCVPLLDGSLVIGCYKTIIIQAQALECSLLWKVLRFFSLWDDSDSMFGETRPVIIHYYLVDDTVEVREVHERNDGRDPFPVLMKRQHLPKCFKDGIGEKMLGSERI